MFDCQNKSRQLQIGKFELYFLEVKTLWQVMRLQSFQNNFVALNKIAHDI